MTSLSSLFVTLCNVVIIVHGRAWILPGHGLYVETSSANVQDDEDVVLDLHHARQPPPRVTISRSYLMVINDDSSSTLQHGLQSMLLALVGLTSTRIRI
jgi:hypothetical protein